MRQEGMRIKNFELGIKKLLDAFPLQEIQMKVG